MRVRVARILVLAVAALALASASACDLRGSGYQYVRSRDTGTYLKIPQQWRVGKPKPGEGVRFLRFIDSDPSAPATLHLYDDVPSGFIRVRSLTVDERDQFSFASLRHELNIDLDQAAEQGLLDLKSAQELSPPGGFRGQRMVFTLHDDTGSEPDITISQTTFVDAKTTRVHVLVVGCTARCYDRHRAQIDTIAKSFTVKEP